jgi:FHA domain-containing protein
MFDRFGDSAVITLVILSLLALAIIVGGLVARRRRRSMRRRDELPLFSVPLTSQPVIARPTMRAPKVPESDAIYAASVTGPESRGVVDRSFAPRAATVRTRDGAVATLARAPRDERDEPALELARDAFGEAVEGASIRYWRPADGTLQFLPGRLEIAAGRDAGQEIRFVRTAGPDGTCITFGRAEGPPYRHVQLREPTVSRAHARLVLDTASSTNGESGGSTTSNVARWRLENLSSTNPVVVNGRALDSSGQSLSSVLLSDGDRIEMGEVAFVFHQR